MRRFWAIGEINKAEDDPGRAQPATSAHGMSESPIPNKTLVAYGLPAFALQATSWVVSLYLLKYATEVLWIAPALVGSILGASRVWDAISDPLIGYASDRTRMRIGRRRPWMLLGAPLLALAFAGLWASCHTNCP